MSNWFKAHAGISTDTKFLRVAKRTGINGATVLGIWVALLDHASTTTPRGSIDSFDAEGYALWAGMDQDGVEAIIEAFGPVETGGVGMHDGHHLTQWAARQAKSDTAAALRMRKLRESRKKAPEGDEPGGKGPNVRERSRTVRTSSHVTALEREIEQSSSSHTSSASDSSTSSDTSRDDACVSSFPMTAGQVWTALEESGVPVGFIAKAKASTTIKGWIASGLTHQQFHEAVERATRARADAGTPHLPLNVGFLNSVITTPVERRARPAAKSYEDGDEASRRFAAQG